MLQLIICMLVLGGLSASNPLEDRILSGSDASVSDARYIVSVRGKFGVHRCAGTIADHNAVLTAAHCIQGLAVTDITVQYLRTINTGTANTIGVRVAVLHPDFDPADGTADVALLILLTSFPPNSVGIITLNENRNLPAVSAGASIYGWGYEQPAGSIQANLKKADLTIFSNEECSNALNRQIYSTQICADSRTTDAAQCTGDSGGPLISGSVQVGIISFSQRPCGTGPGVSTRVADYMCWIRHAYATN